MILFSAEFKQNRTLPNRTLIFPSKDFIFNRLSNKTYTAEKQLEKLLCTVADITCDPTDEIYNFSDKKLLIYPEYLEKLSYINLTK